jgi:hypothetical protein
VYWQGRQGRNKTFDEDVYCDVALNAANTVCPLELTVAGVYYDAMSFVRQRVDPLNTLPQVEMVVDTEYAQQDGYAITAEGIKIGNFFMPFTGTGDAVCFESLIVNERNKGYGLATYVWAIEKAHDAGKTFTNDASVSQSAARVWQKLARAGVAQIVEEFQYIDTIDGIDYYQGEYISPPETIF